MSIKRIDELPDGNDNLSPDDLLLVLDDPSGGSVTKKISVSELLSLVPSELPENIILSNTSGIIGANSITNIISLTQSDYDNIVSKDPATLYIVTS